MRVEKIGGEWRKNEKKISPILQALEKMAFSLARSVSSSVSRMSRRAVVGRKYSSAAHHGAEVGPVEKRVLRTRVVLPSPLGRSNLNPTNIVVPNVAEMEAQAEVTAKKQQGTVEK